MPRISAIKYALLGAAAIFSFGSVPALAQVATTESSAEAPAASQEAAKKEKLICRTESVIGSRAKKRKTCLTRAQWEEVAKKGNAFARSVVESGRSGLWDLDGGE